MARNAKNMWREISSKRGGKSITSTIPRERLTTTDAEMNFDLLAGARPGALPFYFEGTFCVLFEFYFQTFLSSTSEEKCHIITVDSK